MFCNKLHKFTKFRMLFSAVLMSIHTIQKFMCLSNWQLHKICHTWLRVGRYFDILIYRDISNRDYRIEAKNLSDDLSKLSSCSMTIVILLRNMYIACRILKKVESIFAFQQQIYPQNVY